MATRNTEAGGRAVAVEEEEEEERLEREKELLVGHARLNRFSFP
jgi:hypothetical protein